MAINLSHGAGGKEMNELINKFSNLLGDRGNWKHTDDDAAIIKVNNELFGFTTDSYIVSPLFFPGGDIGSLAFNGTVNDLAVMGVRPLGISLGIIIEEGFSDEELKKIIESVSSASKKIGIPVVTGDTKVMEKGKIDKIVINTAGFGVCEKLLDEKLVSGDKVIVSGLIGNHAIALLSKRFDYETSVVSDTKAIINEVFSVIDKIKVAKDPTRGGLASCLNEICSKQKVSMIINDGQVPFHNEAVSVCELMGIDKFQLACEGRFVCVVSEDNSNAVLKKLQEFDKDAAIIGEVNSGSGVVLNTKLGKRVLSVPTGRIIPRIC